MLVTDENTLYAMETMGERISVLRQARGLSVTELAEKIGVTRALVWQWEEDMVKGIRPENFVRLCHALGTTPEYLVWGPDRPPIEDTQPKLRIPKVPPKS
jgi:transcriptional regulator with XRE-family HTH domain